mmetsp:Transcript_27355/g.44526  ORF Transcript_27355/g.44526 Transcript_27355/m.44526 type:complete len:482 (-) Transcript_27355:879-2324(-)
MRIGDICRFRRARSCLELARTETVTPSVPEVALQIAQPKDVFSPFDSCDDGLVVQIFSKLGDGVDCLRICAYVCKRFRALCRDPRLWKKLSWGDENESAAAKLIRSICLHQYPLQQLDLIRASVSYRDLLHIHRIRDSLSTLRLKGNASLTCAFLPLLSRLVNLTSLQLFGFGASFEPFSGAQMSLLSSLTNLEDLVLQYSTVSHTDVTAILSKCKKLVSFTLDVDDDLLTPVIELPVNFTSMFKLLESFPNLTTLHLSHTDREANITFEVPIPSLLLLSNLEVLELTTYSSSYETFALIIHNLTKLTRLSLGSCSGQMPHDSPLSALPSSPSLKSLLIGSNDPLPGCIASWLSANRSLEKLQVCPSLLHGLLHISVIPPNVRSLTFNSFLPLTLTTGMIDALAHVSTLETLELRLASLRTNERSALMQLSRLKSLKALRVSYLQTNVTVARLKKDEELMEALCCSLPETDVQVEVLRFLF